MLSREVILDAAERLDMRALSVRALAGKLRVSDAAIHYHFGSRAALLAALAERSTEGFAFPAARGSWRAWLKRCCENFREALKAHPGAADYLVLSGPARGAQVRIIDRALGVLGGFGFSERNAWLAYVTAVNFTLAHVQAEDRMTRQRRTGTDVETRLKRDTAGDAKAVRLARVAARAELAQMDALFDFGLGAILRGMEP